MVKVRFYKCNMFFSQDTPAYIELDTEGQTIRIRAYEGAVIYVDDTVTNTNRSGYSVIQLWSTNPNPLPPSPIGRAVTVEIYDTSNNLLEKQQLPYLYGTKYKSIPIKDENGFPLGCNVSSIVYPFYYCRANAGYIDIPWSSAQEQRQFYEAYNVVSKKYYFVGRVDAIENLSQIQLIPSDSFIVRLHVYIDPGHLKPILAGVGQLPYVAQFIDTAFNLIVNNVMWLAQAITNALGIRLPIVRVELDSANNILIIYYNQDPIGLVGLLSSPIIEFLIIIGSLAVFINLPRILEIINNATLVQLAQAQAAQVEAIANQNKTVLLAALQQCGNNQECIAQVLNSLNVANVNLTQAMKEIENLRSRVSTLEAQRWGFAAAGVAGGVILSAIVSRVGRP